MAKNYSSAAQAATRIKEYLFSGAVRSGEKLPAEITLGEQLGVSRPTLREALRQLQGTGYVEQIPNRGYFARITDTDMEQQMGAEQARRWFGSNGTSLAEFFEARTVLEPQAARLAAARQDPDALKELQQAQDAFASAQENGDTAQLAKLDNALHAAIIHGAKNRHLNSFFEELTCFFLEYSSCSFSTPVDISRTTEEHAAIVAAIVAGRAEDAAEAMAKHILSAQMNCPKEDGSNG